MKVNGIEITAKKFAFDGCHKIYLLNDKQSEKEAKENGYEIYPIKHLMECYIYSCSLRFINIWGGNFDSVVKQNSDKITFDGFKIPDDIYAPYNYLMKTDKNKLELSLVE